MLGDKSFRTVEWDVTHVRWVKVVLLCGWTTDHQYGSRIEVHLIITSRLCGSYWGHLSIDVHHCMCTLSITYNCRSTLWLLFLYYACTIIYIDFCYPEIPHFSKHTSNIQVVHTATLLYLCDLAWENKVYVHKAPNYNTHVSQPLCIQATIWFIVFAEFKFLRDSKFCGFYGSSYTQKYQRTLYILDYMPQIISTWNHLSF